MTGGPKKPNPHDVLYPTRMTGDAADWRAAFQRRIKTGDRFEAMAEACRRLLEISNNRLIRVSDPDGTEHCAPRTGSVEAAAAAYLSKTKALKNAMAASDTEAICFAARWQGELFADLVNRFGAVKGTQLSVEELAASRVASIRKLTRTGPTEHNLQRKSLSKVRENHALELAKQSGETKKSKQIEYIRKKWRLPGDRPNNSTFYKYLKDS
ncbi:hypothetical protein [Roseobacter ponti]|uniref:Uncharacterized protein n=1 Tax=Roseobacter ponti TaxID=1891787 RepID=A0A858SSM1_9RHOB|nr:hypothetical protein [Roseobacter ponti]QJF50693.1 hypothetical protein G3256_05740 [Roseobacter ponti]